jgi:hypothetical protein
MKWHAQVLHVVRKDLRLSRWLLLAYAAVVAAVTAGAAEWGSATPLPMTGHILLGTVLLAFLVQADSPARGDSLWVTLPLHPSGVFAAKLLVGAVVLIGLPLLGQLVALRTHEVAPADLPRLLGQSALSYGAWLAVAAAFAALTSDLRSFLVALTLAGFAWLFGVRFVLAGAGPSASPGWSTLPLVATGMLLLLAHQYLTRNVRRGALMGGALAVAVLALLAAPARSAAPAASPAGPIPVSLKPASIELGGVALKPGSEAELGVRLTGMSPFHQYVLVSPTVRMHMPDGSSTVVQARERLVSLSRPIPRLEGVRTVSERKPADRFVAMAVVELSPSQRQALAAGHARLSLQGRLEVREPRTRAELPLRTGASDAEGGRRMRIASVESLPEGPEVAVRTSEVGSSADEGLDKRMYGMHAPEYLLVNRSRREALQMRQRSSSGSELALVLPGPSAWSFTAELVLEEQRPDEEPRVRPVWLGAARLLLVTWVPVGSDVIALKDQGRGLEEWLAEDAARGRGR